MTINKKLHDEGYTDGWNLKDLGEETWMLHGDYLKGYSLGKEDRNNDEMMRRLNIAFVTDDTEEIG